MRRLSALPVLAVAGALAWAGCGDDGGSTAASTAATDQPGATAPATVDTTTGPVASAPDAPPPPPEAATTPLPETDGSPGSGTTTGGDGERGGSGERAESEPVRVPAAFKVRHGDSLTPETITVPPFLAIQISVANPDRAPHVVVVRTPRAVTLRIPGGGWRAVRIAGQRAGAYAMTLDGRAAGELVVGGEAGP